MRETIRRFFVKSKTPPRQLRIAPFDGFDSPWGFLGALEQNTSPRACNICWWTGPAFEGGAHCESAMCPECGSIARDRFLFHCFVVSTPETPLGRERYRLLETSPRLGTPYRAAMARWFDYSASDFDQRAHRSELQLDLQEIALEDESLDVILTPHVLEHVPSTDRALAELSRILAPGGRIFLQVPILQGWTTPPPKPEFHGDDTPVFWRFGLDLVELLRRHFETRVLCTQGFYEMVRLGALEWPDPIAEEFDVESILGAARFEDLAPVADLDLTRRLGFHPAYMFLTFEAVKPRSERRPTTTQRVSERDRTNRPKG